MFRNKINLNSKPEMNRLKNNRTKNRRANQLKIENVVLLNKGKN